MKIHHLNLCSMCPFGGRLVSGGERSILESGEMVVHSLLVETDKDGLVLVDTGMGLSDVLAPVKRLGPGFFALARPRLREEDTAVRQVERLGFSAKDVRNIVITHLDADHSGGIPDFPDATIHVHRAEHDAAQKPATLNERSRYRAVHFRHGPRWQLHEAFGERWFGFASVRAVAEDVLIIPLPGHTRGHSAIAVRAPQGAYGGAEWLLHAGDAYFSIGEREDPRACPPVLKSFQKFIATDDDARRANASRLRELYRTERGRVRMFSAHCARELEELRAISQSRT